MPANHSSLPAGDTLQILNMLCSWYNRYFCTKL